MYPPDRRPHPDNDVRTNARHVHEGRTVFARTSSARDGKTTQGENDTLCHATEGRRLAHGGEREGEGKRGFPEEGLDTVQQHRHTFALPSLQHALDGRRQYFVRRHRWLHQNEQQQDRRGTGRDTKRSV